MDRISSINMAAKNEIAVALQQTAILRCATTMDTTAVAGGIPDNDQATVVQTALSGPILAGKSYIIQMLDQVRVALEKANNPHVRLVVSPEPVEAYGEFLKAFYASNTGESKAEALTLRFQTFIFACQNDARKRADAEIAELKRKGFKGIIWHVVERFPLDNIAVFMPVSVRNGLARTSDIGLLAAVCTDKCVPDHVGVVHANTEALTRRFAARKRSSESDMKLPYVLQIAEQYRQVFGEGTDTGTKIDIDRVIRAMNPEGTEASGEKEEEVDTCMDVVAAACPTAEVGEEASTILQREFDVIRMFHGRPVTHVINDVDNNPKSMQRLIAKLFLGAMGYPAEWETLRHPHAGNPDHTPYVVAHVDVGAQATDPSRRMLSACRITMRSGGRITRTVVYNTQGDV